MTDLIGRLVPRAGMRASGLNQGKVFHAAALHTVADSLKVVANLENTAHV